MSLTSPFVTFRCICTQIGGWTKIWETRFLV